VGNKASIFVFQGDLFTKITIENHYRSNDANYPCPFAASAIALTKLICVQLHIGEQVLENVDIGMCLMTLIIIL